MNPRLPSAAELASMVRVSLWRDRDPIGVNESPEAKDSMTRMLVAFALC